MPNEEKNKPSSKKPMPTWLAIPITAILVAVLVLTAVLIHHAKSKKNPDAAEESKLVVTADTGSESTASGETTSAVSASADTTKQQSAGQSDGTTADHTTGTAAGTTEASATGSSSASVTKASSTEQSGAKTTQTTGSKPQYDLSGFGAKWPDKFLISGDPVITDNSYKSKDINIKINQREANGTVYYVADIYIRSIENLKSAFSINQKTKEEDFWEGDSDPDSSRYFQEDGAKLSERVNSVLTINGDYYSGRKTGIIFRNGKLYRDVPRAEVGAIYKDGTYKGFTKADFDVTAEQGKGLWQVMGFEPRLVENGKAIQNIRTLLSGMDVAAPRSGFGYYEPGHYCFVVADGRQEGYSVGPELQEWANFFETLGCDGAFNLDGGASSQMYFMGKLINRPTTGTSGGVVRMLPDVFYIGETTD